MSRTRIIVAAAVTLAVAGILAAVSVADSGYPTYPSQASSTVQLKSGSGAGTSQPGVVTPNDTEVLLCSAPTAIGSNAQHTQVLTYIYVSYCALNGVVLSAGEWDGTSSIYLYYLNRADKQWYQVASTRGLAESPGSKIQTGCGAGVAYKSLVSATVTSDTGVVAYNAGVDGPITC